MKGRAFSSEVETGSRQENASNQEPRAPFRFHRNGKGSSGPITRRGFIGGTLLAGFGGKALAQGFAGLGESAGGFAAGGPGPEIAFSPEHGAPPEIPHQGGDGAGKHPQSRRTAYCGPRAPFCPASSAGG